MDTAKELHLFIIWHNALNAAVKIIEDMKSKFTISRVLAIHWSDKHFSNNLSRFYGQKLPRDSFKEVHCGRGPFLATLVLDEEPTYEVRQTSRGPQVVNTKCFDAKELYRGMTGGGHRIHGTNSPAETDHDLVLLLEQTAAEFLAANPGEWDGEVSEIERDLAGADGWNTISDLFHVLNASIPYAVLRNFEGLPESATLEGHGDIDLLCPNTGEMAFIANGKRVAAESYRVLHNVGVGGQKLLFDFRAVGSNYYDPAWEKEMLEGRVFSSKGFYHLAPEDHFHSLLYHATVHKPSIAPDYVKRLQELAPAEFDIRNARAVLDGFLSLRGYRFVEPNDLSVYFNAGFAGFRNVSMDRVMANSKSLGDAFEKLFDRAEDCSTSSVEFQDKMFRASGIIPFFSPNRWMFFDGLNLDPGKTILEIGGESGVLTRWFGERFQQVTALDSRPDLVAAIRKRCKDLNSVKVAYAGIDDFNGTRNFDVVVSLVEIEVKSANAPEIMAAIRCAKRALKKTGLFILGFDAVESVADIRDAVLHQLKSYGFTSAEFYCAFPSVNLPRVVFSEAGVRAAKRSFGYWAAFARKEAGLAANELETVGASADGKLDTKANSCYILASFSPDSIPVVPWQVLAISSEIRHPSLRASTRVIAGGDQSIVRKTGTPRSSGVFRFEPELDCPVFEGHTGSAALLYMIQSGDLSQFLALLKAYAQNVVRNFAFAGSAAYKPLLAEGDTLLRGEALDAIPQNAVIADNSYQFFDLEWRVSIPLPLSFLMYRCLTVFFIRVSPAIAANAFKLEQYGLSKPNAVELAQFFMETLRLFGPLNKQALQQIRVFETRFLNFVLNGEVCAEEASLFERYHTAIALHAQGDYEASDNAIIEMRAAYPDAPEPIALVEATAR